MRRVLLITACAAIVLAGCQKVESDGAVDAAAPAAKGEEAKPSEAMAAPRLAYRYRYEIELPGSEVTKLMDQHEATCLRAGPSVCQIVGRKMHDAGEGEVNGALNIRAVPSWLDAFRGGLAGQAATLHGKLTSNQTNSEDLTVKMVDTDAAIRAKIALRDRLQALVAHHDGKLADLLEVENQLAQVQGQIDAARSGRAVMRQQVAMSDLTVAYSPLPALASSRTWSPVASAVRDSSDILAVVLAFLIRAAALLAAPAVIVWSIWRLARRQPKKPATT